MKETLNNYIDRLKKRITEDDYNYTNENFEQYSEYIKECWKQNLSVYKCLEFMYFEKQ